MVVIKTDYEIYKVEMEKYFGFLISDFGFIKFPEYQIPHEIHNDFIKQNTIIKIVWDGVFSVSILEPLQNIDEILNLQKCTWDYDSDFFRTYDLAEIDYKKQLYNSIVSEDIPDQELWYFSKLLKENLEILEGNFKKFKYSYQLIKKIKNILKIKEH